MLLNVTSCLLQLNRRYSGGMLNFKVHFEGSLEVQTIALKNSRRCPPMV